MGNRRPGSERIVGEGGSRRRRWVPYPGKPDWPIRITVVNRT